jgi:ribonuclease E
MVLESNRDLVLRRLTEALARDRTRHQVSEVTSLGLVQLTRKRLGTGLIEAFSTNCSECSGRGIVVHADPVDNASANGDSRRAESSGGRRGRRGKKGRGDEPAVARVPAHTPGEHPMFKAMAATTAHDGEDDSDESLVEGDLEENLTPAVVLQVAEEDDDVDEEDEDEELDPLDDHALDEDDDDLDADDADDADDDDEDDDDDDDDQDGDEDFDDEDDDDDDDDDEDDDDEDDDDEDDDGGSVASAPLVAPGRSRRRAAARPAGPPVSDI